MREPGPQIHGVEEFQGTACGPAYTWRLDRTADRPGGACPSAHGDWMHRYRTHTCNDLRATDVGITARLSGWLHNRRSHGGIVFVDLRDHYGITQLVARPGSPGFEQLSRLLKETVLRVDGTVVLRGS